MDRIAYAEPITPPVKQPSTSAEKPVPKNPHAGYGRKNVIPRKLKYELDCEP